MHFNKKKTLADGLTLLQAFTQGTEQLGVLFNDCANVYYHYSDQVKEFFSNVIERI